VALTPPYMHDGVFKTLTEVIEHYDDIESSLKNHVFQDDTKNYNVKLIGPNSEINEKKLSSLSIKLEKKLYFTEEEEKALEEFLVGALTERRFLPLLRKN
jgi:cytochrome c peroxidase